MTEFKHTPGPWAISKKARRRVTAKGITICNAVLRNQGGPKHKISMKDEAEAIANAHLIAAAPELLDALQWTIDEIEGRTIYDNEGQFDNCIENVYNAIKKAKGE